MSSKGRQVFVLSIIPSLPFTDDSCSLDGFLTGLEKVAEFFVAII